MPSESEREKMLDEARHNPFPSAHDQPEESDGWIHIDNIPLNEEEVLIFFVKTGSFKPAGMALGWWGQDECDVVNSEGVFRFDLLPTHFMHLPKNPENYLEVAKELY